MQIITPLTILFHGHQCVREATENTAEWKACLILGSDVRSSGIKLYFLSYKKEKILKSPIGMLQWREKLKGNGFNATLDGSLNILTYISANFCFTLTIRTGGRLMGLELETEGRNIKEG